MTNLLSDIKLLKKYHTTLVHDYTEYPTKRNWDENYGEKEFKSNLIEWYKRNKDAKVVFYVHTPFCEQLCYFCLCSKEITKDYEKVKNYLYNYLFKEIDLLKKFLNENEIRLNFKEVYLGGGSPTYYKNEEFVALVNKITEIVDFSNIGDFTIEVDPRRVDEEKLIFYSENKVNRLSFGVQDFDLEVQKRINRIQPPSLFKNLLTEKVRNKFNAINFDLLIGLPGQTKNSISQTIDHVTSIKPTQIQTMYMHYKPTTRKYMINMLREGPLPDFYDRKEVFLEASEKLYAAGYERAGFESFALPNDVLTKSINEKKANYGPLGTQKGEAINFFSVGSSAHGYLSNDYYVQNYYELNLYREALDQGILPIYRGLKLSDDDKVRQKIVKDLRTYFEIDFKEIEKEFNINFKEKFIVELQNLKNFEKDNLVEILEDKVVLTKLGQHFSPQVANVFDHYNDQKIYNKVI